MKGRGVAGELRDESVDVRFTAKEVRALKAISERDDRSLSGTVHWIARQYMRGELVAKPLRVSR